MCHRETGIAVSTAFFLRTPGLCSNRRPPGISPMDVTASFIISSSPINSQGLQSAFSVTLFVHARASRRACTAGILSAPVSGSLPASQPHILFFLLYVQLEAGKYEEAVVTGRRCLDFRPNDARVHHLVGVALSSLDRLPEAAASVERAGSRDPDNPLIHRTLGDILANRGRYKEAITSYDRCLSLDPAHEVAKKRRAQLISLIDRKKDR